MNRVACAVLALALGLAASGAAFALGEYEESDWVFGSGSVLSQDREVPAFRAVELEGSGNLTIRQGPEGPVRVETDENVLPLVKTEVVDGVLHLGLVAGAHVTRMTRLEFTVTSPAVSGLTVSGSGNIRTVDVLRGRSLVLQIHGSGSISCGARVERLQADIGGSGGIDSYGTADRLSVAIRGSGSLRAHELSSADAEVNIAGSGDALLYVTNTLDAEVSGSGSVRYGGGARATVRTTGSGSVSTY